MIVAGSAKSPHARRPRPSLGKFLLALLLTGMSLGLSGYSYYMRDARSPSLDPMPNKVQYLTANGTGTIIIEADYADLTVRMGGKIFVTEPEAIYIENYRSSRMDQWKRMSGTTYRGVKGEVSYVGNNFVMVIQGSVQDLQISGSARIKFKGQGRMTLNDDLVKKWRSDEIIALLM